MDNHVLLSSKTVSPQLKFNMAFPKLLSLIVRNVIGAALVGH